MSKFDKQAIESIFTEDSDFQPARAVNALTRRLHLFLTTTKIPLPIGNGTDFSSCAPLKTHSDHEILLLMVFPFSGTY